MEGPACGCGAPARGPVCQRGHRLAEAWSPQARLAAIAARKRGEQMDPSVASRGSDRLRAAHRLMAGEPSDGDKAMAVRQVKIAASHLEASDPIAASHARDVAERANAGEDVQSEVEMLHDQMRSRGGLPARDIAGGAAAAAGGFKARPPQLLKQRGQ